jgi:hypothetical protein
MGLQLAALGPLIGFVVMIDVTEQQAAIGAMDNQTDISTNADRPEVRVPCSAQLVKLHARARRI